MQLDRKTLGDLTKHPVLLDLLEVKSIVRRHAPGTQEQVSSGRRISPCS